MRMSVRVIPRAKRRSVEARPDGSLLVRVTEPAEDGRANAALVELVAEHLGLPKRAVTILHGHTSRQKTLGVIR